MAPRNSVAQAQLMVAATNHQQKSNGPRRMSAIRFTVTSRVCQTTWHNVLLFLQLRTTRSDSPTLISVHRPNV